MNHRAVIVDGENYESLAAFLVSIGIDMKANRKEYEKAIYQTNKGRVFTYQNRQYRIIYDTPKAAPQQPEEPKEPKKHILLKGPQTMGLHQDRGEHWL